MKKKIVTLQELATFMRNVSYSDNRLENHNLPKLDWSLSVIHPSTNKGVVGFSGGIWTESGYGRESIAREDYKSVHISYDEIDGIYNFGCYKGGCQIHYSFDDEPTFEEFKQAVMSLFNVKKLYERD